MYSQCAFTKAKQRFYVLGMYAVRIADYIILTINLNRNHSLIPQNQIRSLQSLVNQNWLVLITFISLKVMHTQTTHIQFLFCGKRTGFIVEEPDLEDEMLLKCGETIKDLSDVCLLTNVFNCCSDW